MPSPPNPPDLGAVPCFAAEVRQIRKSTGATVNDVVMAICAGGLRNWLSANDCLPDKPLTGQHSGVDPG